MRFLGVSTSTWMYMSPITLERSTGMPLPLRRNCLPVSVPSGTFTRVLPPSTVGTSMLAAERRRRHRDRHAAEDVGAVALEELVRLDRQEDVEVAGRAAAQAGLALAGQADAGAVLDARRDVDRQRALLDVTRPEPLQEPHGSLMISPRPWHDGQVRSMVKKPWLARTLPAPPQVGQVEGCVPRLGARCRCRPRR